MSPVKELNVDVLRAARHAQEELQAHVDLDTTGRDNATLKAICGLFAVVVRGQEKAFVEKAVDEIVAQIKTDQLPAPSIAPDVIATTVKVYAEERERLAHEQEAVENELFACGEKIDALKKALSYGAGDKQQLEQEKRILEGRHAALYKNFDTKKGRLTILKTAIDALCAYRAASEAVAVGLPPGVLTVLKK